MNIQCTPTIFLYNESLETLIQNFSNGSSNIYETYTKIVNLSKNKMLGFSDELFDEFLSLRLGIFFISDNDQIIFKSHIQEVLINNFDQLIDELRRTAGVKGFVIESFKTMRLHISTNIFTQSDLRDTFGFIHMCWDLIENKNVSYDIIERLLPYDSGLKCCTGDFTHNAILALLNTIPSKEIALA